MRLEQLKQEMYAMAKRDGRVCLTEAIVHEIIDALPDAKQEDRTEALADMLAAAHRANERMDKERDAWRSAFHELSLCYRNAQDKELADNTIDDILTTHRLTTTKEDTPTP